MIFVPFTGVDHHKKCVTFASALLYDETIESFTWLLECFLKAHGTQPSLVLTDQDPAMKQAVARVFNQSVHRLCMWHIMYKLPLKVDVFLFLHMCTYVIAFVLLVYEYHFLFYTCVLMIYCLMNLHLQVSGNVLQNTNLRQHIHKLVWNVFISPATFEERWDLLMNDCNLMHHKWLSDMFSIRDQWVPAYFRDIPMCCLMKTTSRSECSNAVFKINSSPSNTLVQFMLCFDTSIDRQRYEQRVIEYQTDSTTPLLRTHLDIEKHASLVYTRTIFNEVQKEMCKSVTSCMIGRPDVIDGFEDFIVYQIDTSSHIVGEYKVIF